MPDEATAPVVEDQPTPEVAEQPTEAPQPEVIPSYFEDTFDPATLSDELRPAYKQMQGAWTQKTQDLAAQRKEIEQEQELLSALRSDDPSVQSQALEFLGYEIPQTEEAEEDYVEPLDELRAQIAELQSARTADTQAQQTHKQEQEELDNLESQFEALEKETGRELSDDEVDVIAGLSFSRRDDQGRPDVKGAYERIYSDLLSKERERWVGSKQAPKAPAGQSGTQKVDMSDEDTRVNRMAEIMARGD